MPPAERQVARCNSPCGPSARRSTPGAELCPRLPGSKAGEMPVRPVFPLRASFPAGAQLAAGRSRPLTQAGSDRGGGKTVSAFGELWFGGLSYQPCICDGLRGEVKEGTRQGVTLFTKSRGTVEKKDKSLGACAETAAQFPLCVFTFHNRQGKCLLNMNCELSPLCNVTG